MNTPVCAAGLKQAIGSPYFHSMKALALVFLILLVFLTGIVAILYFFGFVMSFDAPGSDKDPAAWQTRMILFLPVILCIALLIGGFIAYLRGRYGMSVIMTGIPMVLAVIGFAAMVITSMSSLNDYKAERAREAELAKKYPVEKYLRPANGGTDTVIVWPNGIVAYRLYIGTAKPWGGPLGDLNPARDTLFYYEHQDTRVRREELTGFTDAEGRVFTEVYQVK